MLVLTRKLGEKISIGNGIMVVVTEIRGNHVKLGVEAPKEVSIYREEVLRRTIEENKAAATGDLQELQGLLDSGQLGKLKTGNKELNKCLKK